MDKRDFTFFQSISIHRRCSSCGNSKGWPGISSNLVVFDTCTKTFGFLSIHSFIAIASKRLNFYSNTHSNLKVNAKLEAIYAVSWL